MAITITTNTPNDDVFGNAFSIQGVSANLSGCEELKAAPAAGVSIYLDSVLLSTDTAVSITIGEGETSSAPTTARFGPIFLPANTTVAWIFRRPIKMTAATSLTIDASGAANVTAVVEGYTK